MSTQMCDGALSNHIFWIDCKFKVCDGIATPTVYRIIPQICKSMEWQEVNRRWERTGRSMGCLEEWMRSVRCGSLVGFLICCHFSLWLFHHWLFIECRVWNLVDISGWRCGAHLGLQRQKLSLCLIYRHTHTDTQIINIRIPSPLKFQLYPRMTWRWVCSWKRHDVIIWIC